MQIVTSWMEQGIEQGLQQGIEQGLRQGIEQGLQQGIEQGLQQGVEQGLQQGREQGEINLVLRLLTRRFGPLAPAIETQIRNLSLEQLENLADALLDFQNEIELQRWLREIQ